MRLEEFFQEAWRRAAGLPPKHDARPKAGKAPSYRELWESEWCPELEKAARQRLVMGVFRYGLMAEQDYGKYDLTAEAKIRIKLYEDSVAEKRPNLEHLVDAWNIVQLAFIKGKRQGHEIIPSDDGHHTKELT